MEITRCSSLATRRYSIEPRTRKYVKGNRFLTFARNLFHKYKIQLLDAGLDSSKHASKKLVQKTGEFLGNKTADAVAKLYDDKIVKTRPVEEIIIPPEKREEILNESEQVL